MAHRLSLRKRRSTTTAIFLLPFCENAFFMKESPPQMSPHSLQFALQLDKCVWKAGVLYKIFPRLNPIALAGLYSNTLGLHCVYERLLLPWFLWAPNGRSSSSTNMENMAPSLCVNAQPCDRGQSDRGDHSTSTPDLNPLTSSEKYCNSIVGITKDWSFFSRRYIW